MRIFAAILVLLVASCAGPTLPAAQQKTVACHTGGAEQDDDSHAVDRGIGGTGVSDAEEHADRGIGGTGIVGIVDGFGSLCVDGLELRIDDHVPVLVDGVRATPQALRIGQLVAVTASGPRASLTARRIVVQHDVFGPIQAIDHEARTMVVAGQTVLLLPHRAWGRKRLSVGDWIAVSGLHEPDGTLVATRLETTTPGSLVIYGPLEGTPGKWRIGRLPLLLPKGAKVSAGQWAGVRGILVKGVLVVQRLASDMLEADAPAYFGRNFDHLIVQSYAHRHGRRLALTGGLDVPMSLGSGDAPGDAARSRVLALDRDGDGILSATELADGDDLLPEPPVPPAQ